MIRGKATWPQREDSHLQAKETGLRRNQPSLILGFQPPNYENTSVCLKATQTVMLCFGRQSRLIHRPLASAWMGVVPQGSGGLLSGELPSPEVFILRAGLDAVGSGLHTSAPSTAWPQGSAMSQIKDWDDDKAKLQG